MKTVVDLWISGEMDDFTEYAKLSIDTRKVHPLEVTYYRKKTALEYHEFRNTTQGQVHAKMLEEGWHYLDTTADENVTYFYYERSLPDGYTTRYVDPFEKERLRENTQYARLFLDRDGTYELTMEFYQRGKKKQKQKYEGITKEEVHEQLLADGWQHIVTAVYRMNSLDYYERAIS